MAAAASLGDVYNVTFSCTLKKKKKKRLVFRARASRLPAFAAGMGAALPAVRHGSGDTRAASVARGRERQPGCWGAGARRDSGCSVPGSRGDSLAGTGCDPAGAPGWLKTGRGLVWLHGGCL